MTTPRLRIATRGSALAQWQAQHVAQLLRGGAGGRAIEIELVVIETTADRRLDISIEQMGGKGVFVKEIQEAVLDGRADLAVHSAKDLPSVTVDGLVLASITERADPRDVLVGARYDALASGAHIATGAQRRRAQLAFHRPDLRFSDLRGNIATRLAKSSSYDAIVMAKAQYAMKILPWFRVSTRSSNVGGESPNQSGTAPTPGIVNFTIISTTGNTVR